MKQHPWDSFLEAVTNNFVAYFISMVAWAYVIDPLFNLHTSMQDNFLIVGIFTILSITRSYILRRIFDGQTIYEKIVGRRVR